MMVWPAWLGTKLFAAKAWVWLAHRVTTGSGAAYVWKRWRKHPGFWWWFALINAASIASLFAIFFWIDHMKRAQ